MLRQTNMSFLNISTLRRILKSTNHSVHQDLNDARQSRQITVNVKTDKYEFSQNLNITKDVKVTPLPGGHAPWAGTPRLAAPPPSRLAALPPSTAERYQVLPTAPQAGSPRPGLIFVCLNVHRYLSTLAGIV